MSHKGRQHLMGTGTYANRLLTPSQTELISLLGQLEASSSSWGEEEEEEDSVRITIGNRKQEQGSSGELAQGFGTHLLHPAMTPCPCAGQQQQPRSSLLPEASCGVDAGLHVVPVTSTSWGQSLHPPACPWEQGKASPSKASQT